MGEKMNEDFVITIAFDKELILIFILMVAIILGSGIIAGKITDSIMGRGYKRRIKK